MEEQEISIFPERTIIYAGFWQRFAAVVIDALVLALPNFIIRYITGGEDTIISILTTHTVGLSAIASQLASVATDWLYMSLMESGPAQATLGKMAVGIIVTGTDGNRISFSTASGRYFAKYLSFIILFVGYFMMLWDDRSQTLHDKLAGTLVVKKQSTF